MTLEHRTLGSALLVTLPPRLVKADAPGVRDTLKRLISDGQKQLVLDMGATEFADSSGLSVLISALNAAKAAGGDVVLLNPTPPIRSLLELTRLHHVFQIFEDADAAAAAF